MSRIIDIQPLYNGVVQADTQQSVANTGVITFTQTGTSTFRISAYLNTVTTGSIINRIDGQKYTINEFTPIQSIGVYTRATGTMNETYTGSINTTLQYTSPEVKVNSSWVGTALSVPDGDESGFNGYVANLYGNVSTGSIVDVSYFVIMSSTGYTTGTTKVTNVSDYNSVYGVPQVLITTSDPIFLYEGSVLCSTISNPSASDLRKRQERIPLRV